MNRARFLSLARSKLGLCSANRRAGCFSNLACDWLSKGWAYSEQETKNGSRFAALHPAVCIWLIGSILLSYQANTHWPLISKWYFDIHFRAWKQQYFDSNDIAICFPVDLVNSKISSKPSYLNHYLNQWRPSLLTYIYIYIYIYIYQHPCRLWFMPHVIDTLNMYG